MNLRRNRLPFTALLVLFAASAVSATPSTAGGDARATLRALELKRFEAQVSADAKVLGELLDDDLEYVHSNGDLESKQAFIDSLISGKRDYASIVATIETIRVFKGFAIIRGKARVTVVDAGTSRDLHIGFTDVWVEKDGQWRMTAWRSTRLPDSPVK